MTTANLIPEKDLAATVDGLAQAHGWLNFGVLEQRVYARRTSKGFPDRVLVRGHVLILAELKSETGKLSPEQIQWGLALHTATEMYPDVHVVVWRPSDLDEIEALLSAPEE